MVDEVGGGLFCQGAGELFLKLRRAGGEDGGGLEPFPFCQPAVEGFHSTEAAGEGACAKTTTPFVRHPRPHVADADFGDGAQTLRCALVLLHERQKAQNIGLIGSAGVVGGRGERFLGVKPFGQSVRQRGGDHPSHRRMARSKTPAKKVIRSAPCCGVKRCGSSEPKSNIPGKRPSPKSSFRQASDRT